MERYTEEQKELIQNFSKLIDDPEGNKEKLDEFWRLLTEDKKRPFRAVQELTMFWEQNVADHVDKLSMLLIAFSEGDAFGDSWTEPIGEAATRGLARTLEDAVLALNEMWDTMRAKFDELKSEGARGEQNELGGV
ncbi:MAG: hypothetical protein C4519_14890 [Desulfobacteraceae bacterium]|nr:MAG: hypothetical protein C4519_14890 [Desulfobacteraceae bacterium]